MKGDIPDIVNNTDGLYEGNLRAYFKPLFHSRGCQNPYHGIRHYLFVFHQCYQAIKWYKANGSEISKRNARSLLIASLTHDAMHTGRSGDDDLNIQFALRFLDKHLQKEDGCDKFGIFQQIRSTEYGPDGHVHKSQGELQKILRDADLSQALSNSWIRIVLFGLSEELQITPYQMLLAQEKFLTNLQFESAWGAAVLQPQVEDKLNEARALVEILQ
jgi:hypothetical protein